MTLSPLGIFSAAGSSLPPAFELIATGFGTGSNSAITFSSIPQTYKHLQIRYTGKHASSTRNLELRMNNVSGNFYFRKSMLGNGTAISSTNSGTAATGSILLTDGLMSSSPSGAAAVGIIDIFDYQDTSKNTTIRANYGQVDTTNNVCRVNLTSGFWNNTAAATAISLQVPAGQFESNTRFSLYGIKSVNL